MGIVNKGSTEGSEVNKKFKNPVTLDDREIEFILEKLQTAQYIGREFEMFYNVWVKLSNMKKDRD